MTVFQGIEWFFRQVAERIGSPTPYFFRVIAAIWGFLLTASAVLEGLSHVEGAHFPAKLMTCNKYIIAIAAMGIVQAFLAKHDQPNKNL